MNNEQPQPQPQTQPLNPKIIEIGREWVSQATDHFHTRSMEIKVERKNYTTNEPTQENISFYDSRKPHMMTLKSAEANKITDIQQLQLLFQQDLKVKLMRRRDEVLEQISDIEEVELFSEDE